MAGEDGRLMSFVTEQEIEKIKKIRQEQWDKVRKAGDPKEDPQERVYDPRPLYERLKEQREKQQEIQDEKFKLKNMIYQGLDDEELKFLNNVATQQAYNHSELLKQERQEINVFREAVSQLNVKESEQRLTDFSSFSQPMLSPTVKMTKKPPIALIASSIRRKRSCSDTSDTSTSPSEKTVPEKKTKLLHCDKTPKSQSLDFHGGYPCSKSSGLLTLASYSSSGSSSDEET